MQEIFEKIIERLERERDIHKNAYDVAFLALERTGYASYARACDEAIEIVNQVAEEYVPDKNFGKNDGWIPCSERLPKIRDRYLCQIESTSYSYMDILYFSKNLEEVDKYDFMGEKRAGFYSYDSEYGHCENDGVIAWQPLPEKYQPKGELI